MQKQETNEIAELKEKQAYEFQVLRKTEIYGQNYFILLDPLNDKHLLPAMFYENYGIKPGKKLTCYIDKINCSGAIYLEPEHPDFLLGENYEFEVLKRAKHRINDENRRVLLAKNHDREPIPLFFFKEKHPPKPQNGKVRGKLIRISKGVFFLEKE